MDRLQESKAMYQQSINASVRGLWSGAGDGFWFLDSMLITLRSHLTKAWNEGAAEVGIKPDEMTVQETSARENFINGQFSHLTKFMDAISAGSKANKGLLRVQLKRSQMWAARWDEAKRLGRMMAAADAKQLWVLGRTKVHCSTCGKMSGKVKRSSQFLAHGVLPQTRALECGGWRCLCQLVPTDLPMSKGRLPGA